MLCKMNGLESRLTTRLITEILKFIFLIFASSVDEKLHSLAFDPGNAKRQLRYSSLLQRVEKIEHCHPFLGADT